MSEPAVRNSGFIFLHRSIRDHWIYKDAVKFQWWVDILMECNHSDQNVSIGYQLMECRRGQSLNSLLTWSKRWRVDISTVRRFLKLLENDSMIVTENLQLTTRLTVCNYDTYNSERQATQFQDLNGNQNSPKKIPQKSTHLKSCECDDCKSKQHLTQSQRNSDATQTITINNDKEGEEFSSTQKEDFKKFQNWIKDHAPRVSKMKEPFTINQFLELKNTMPAKKISELLKAMHNYEPLLKKNVSANLTLRKWANRDEPSSPELSKQQPVTGSAPLKH